VSSRKKSPVPARPWGTTAALLVGVTAVVHGIFWLQSGFFEPLAARVTDRLMVLRSKVDWLRPAYDDTVVHVVIDDESVRTLGDFYLGRDDHARLVRNLARVKVASQFHDVIFAAPQDPAGDSALAEATAAAGNVYYGMGAGLSREGQAPPVPPPFRQVAPAVESPEEGALAGAAPPPTPEEILERAHWQPVVSDPDALPLVRRPFVTFPQVAAPARGIGFLDVTPDRDGVYRRAPLLARHGDGFVPSLALRVACDYLGVPPERIEVEPGRRIVLRGAKRPGDADSHDVVIPVDDRGRIVVNFLGPWGTMRSYPFSVVYQASDDRFTIEDLREDMQGRIAVVSWFATGAEDIGATPVEPLHPRAGIHSAVIHSILTGQFLRATDGWQTFAFVEVPLLVVLFVAAVRLPTARFVAVSAGVWVVWGAVVVAAFLWADLVLDLPRPVFVAMAATAVVAGAGFLEQT
jgi:CHASE2 domain-containing sensor protein